MSPPRASAIAGNSRAFQTWLVVKRQPVVTEASTGANVDVARGHVGPTAALHVWLSWWKARCVEKDGRVVRTRGCTCTSAQAAPSLGVMRRGRAKRSLSKGAAKGRKRGCARMQQALERPTPRRANKWAGGRGTTRARSL